VSALLALVGRWRTAEQVSEFAIAVFAPVAVIALAWAVLAQPLTGRPMSALELTALLGAVATVTGWGAGRVSWRLGVRRPRLVLVIAAAAGLAVIAALGLLSRAGFLSRCASLGGELVASALFAGPSLTTYGGERLGICRIGGVPGNLYLPGTLLRAAWTGALAPPLWLGFTAAAGLAGLGWRDRPLRSTRLVAKLLRHLQHGAAAGLGSIAGSPSGDGRVQACGNATLWGELCGQLYAADRAFAPGERCARCHQVYQRCETEVSLAVVSLFSADIEELNSLERLDTNAWSRGGLMPPAPQLSGRERWVVLGRVQVPDVLTMSQCLALVHDRFGSWSGEGSPARAAALSLAISRASRVAAWLWFGPVSHRLNHARPTRRVSLAVGSERLRDLLADTGGEGVTLQLEIGMLPLELRTAFRRTFRDESRPPVTQNSVQSLWVPTAPPGAPGGVWVPRLEGRALRAWLTTDQLHPEGSRGVTTPLPYVPRGAEVSDTPPAPGSLDFVRMPLGPEEREPSMQRLPGASISEWDWFDAGHLELLRRQSLVLVSATGAS